MKVINTSGRRKSAIARAALKSGKGIVRINSILLDNYNPPISKAKIQEPLVLASTAAKKVDISVNVNGGGPTAQADAIRLAIARALVDHDKNLEKIFLEYDRTLLVGDVRFKESSKPNCQGKARSKRQKSYR